MKKRADIILYEKGLVESQEKGKRIIMEGIVFVGNIRVDKPGEELDENLEITIKENTNIYVSRGGLKLEKSIETFDLSLNEKVSMDIGSSTGGFTDCMLKNGASKVFAVDVGYGQLDWKLRNDPKVVVMERTNIRHVEKEHIGQDIDFISIDVSFISLKLVLPVTKILMAEDGEIVALVKPQFEVRRDQVGDKGIVRDKDIHFEVIKNIKEYCADLELGFSGLTYSPITGAKGNIEFLAYLKNNSKDSLDDQVILDIIEEAHSRLI